MSDEGNRQPIDDERLNRLIRQAGQVPSSDFRRPSDDVVRAYVLGEADGSQKDEMRAALLKSADFRKEIAQLTEELDRLPTREFFESVDKLQKVATKSKIADGSAESLFQRLTGWLSTVLVPTRMPNWIPAGAAAVAVVAISLTFLMRGERYTDVRPDLVTLEVEAEMLRGVSTRSSDPDRPQGFATSYDAAMSSFRGMLEFREGQFLILPSTTETSADKTREVTVQISLGENSKRVFRASIGHLANQTPNSTEAWILLLPSRSLYRLPITGDAVNVNLENATDQQFLVALTWQISDLYHSTVARSK